MILDIAVRDSLTISRNHAEFWLKSAGIVGALKSIAEYWWVHKIEAPETEAREVRKQLLYLEMAGYLDLEPERS